MVNAVVAKLGIKAHAHMLRHVEKIILTPPPTKNGALCTSTECRCLGGLLDSNEAAGLEWKAGGREPLGAGLFDPPGACAVQPRPKVSIGNIAVNDFCFG
jgi:hypothetical protein